LINLLTHPENKVEKVYRVDINRPLNNEELNILRKGVEIEGGKTLPAGIFVKSKKINGMTLKMVITEGKKKTNPPNDRSSWGKGYLFKTLAVRSFKTKRPSCWQMASFRTS